MEASCPFLENKVLFVQTHGHQRMWAQGADSHVLVRVPGSGLCPLGLRRGTHLHCSWEEMFIQDHSPGVNSVPQSHRCLEQAAVGQSRAMTLGTQSWTPAHPH